MSAPAGLAYQGASVRAIQHHYDAGNDFYRLWLDPTLTYSCALWADGDDDEDLAAAQARKLDHHIAAAHAHGVQRALDIGCGWGSLLQRLVGIHGASHAVGLTLSAAQAEWLDGLRDPRLEIRQENWFDHEPAQPYDAILSIEAFEAFAKPDLTAELKADVYRAFFARCHAWLRAGGWMSLQTIAWGSARRGESSGFVERQIFPESDLPTLAEIATAAERLFEVVAVRNDRDDYARTCRVWLARLKRERAAAERAVGADLVARYEKYLKIAWMAFHTGKAHLYRLTLRRIDEAPA